MSSVAGVLPGRNAPVGGAVFDGVYSLCSGYSGKDAGICGISVPGCRNAAWGLAGVWLLYGIIEPH